MSQTLVQLATIRYLDTNPISVLSMFTLVCCVLWAIALSRSAKQQRSKRQLLAAIAAQLTVLYICVIVAANPYGADVALTCVIGLSFGFGFSLSAMRGPSVVASTLAVLASTIAIYFTGIAFIEMLDIVLSEHKNGRVINDGITDYGPLLPAGLWMVYGFWLAPRLRQHALIASRSSEGHCPQCTYDLRGSIGKTTCPECGEVIDWAKVVIHEQT